MKNILNFISIVLMLSVVSCDGEEFVTDFDRGSGTQPVDDITHQTLDDYIRGAYWSLFALSANGNVISLWAYNDIASDMLEFKTYSRLNETGFGRWITPIYERQVSENTNRFVDHGFYGAYIVLRSVNNILDFYQENDVPPDNPQWENRLKGESYFLRAFAHYTLATVFAPPYSSDQNALTVPLMLTSPGSPTDLQPLASNEELYAAIISDLKRAIELLPETYDPSRDPVWYGASSAKRDAARFLLARVYFRMGSGFWTSGFDGDGGALEQINTIINAGRYDVPPHDDMLSGIYTRKDKDLPEIPEVVFKLDFVTNNPWRAPIVHEAYSRRTPGGGGQNRGLAFNKRMLREIGWDNEAFAAQDQRYRDLFVRFEAEDSGTPSGDPMYPNNEYLESFNLWTRKYELNNITWQIFRYPEMHLMRAVIRVESGDGTGAAEDINITRQRAELDPLTTATATDVEHEWIKEFAMEHRRLAYLQALKRPVPVPGNQDNPATVPYDDASLVRSLPNREVSRNPNID